MPGGSSNNQRSFCLNLSLTPEIITSLPFLTGTAHAVVEAALNRQQTVIMLAESPQTGSYHFQENSRLIGTEVAPGTLLADPIMIEGRRRVEILDIGHTDPYNLTSPVVRAQILQEPPYETGHIQTLIQSLIELVKYRLKFNHTLSGDIIERIFTTENPGYLCDLLASAFHFPFADRQKILDTLDIEQRLQHTVYCLSSELNLLTGTQTPAETIEDQGNSFNLNDQITEMFGDDIFQQDLTELQERIDAADLPEEVYRKAQKELSRLAIMPPMVPEVGVIHTYLDWLITMPWTEESEDNLDIANADATLESEHYGLPKVKERILEHIAVRKLAAEKMKSPILCFVGPPGVGKTSLGKTIAKALGREFVRMSLGGMRDESEIRGHRRTYIGAMPGRILQALRRAGTINPVFMLDEIDKLGMDYRGDPSDALLEVLDPEQNYTFTDHYLELPYDLSKVMFIVTANDLYSLSLALEDRLEIIEFSGYTEEEKIQIARKFLIPKQLEANGLAAHPVTFEVNTLETIIREYTYEAGVRNLEREIARVCRKIARLVAEGKNYPKRITLKRITEYLGPPQRILSHIVKEDSIGIATGLVWTSGGGDIQTIEVSILYGKGSVTMTGQLGDVLQESIQTAMSYMRTRARDMDVPYEDFENYDIHIHMPEGSVPKDGPSAGITLATAIISAFTERKVRSNFAMTGEITLRGKVLAVGGIKEKVLAARRNNIENIILPQDNQKDLVEVPKQALKNLNIIFIENMQEVIDLVLQEAPEKRQRDIDNEDEDDEAEAEDDE